MVGEIKFELTGVDEMRKVLRLLGVAVEKKLAKRADRAGTEPVIAEAKRLVPFGTGALRDSIDVFPLRQLRNGAAVIEMGVKKPVSRRFHLTEFGTAHSVAKPFFRPAMDEKAGDALSAMADDLAKGIKSEAKKLVKK